jgi:hypothetical protein
LTQRVSGVNQRRTAGLPPSSASAAQKADMVSIGVVMAFPSGDVGGLSGLVPILNVDLEPHRHDARSSVKIA